MRLADEDRKWMQLALAEAEKGVGCTRPNPPVGAVVVKNGKKVGSGWHRKAGAPHAEIEALRSAGRNLSGATMYVTLEPCSTHGRTPPCTDSLVAAGIGRVVYAVGDPNPAHANKSAALLRKAGIRVSSGVCREEAQRLIAPFAKTFEKGLPFLTLKLGMTLDGGIADRRGTSQWITGPESRKDVQALRRTADAILVGALTARQDNPSLIPRPAHGRKPFRVVLDGTKPLPGTLALFSDSHADRTILFTRHDRQRRLEKRGVMVIGLPHASPAASLRLIMKELASLDVMHVLCEGGGTLAGALTRAGLVDRYVLYYAPMLLGGDSIRGISGPGFLLSNAGHLVIQDMTRLGRDVKISAVTNRHHSGRADYV